MLIRMRELATQAVNGTYAQADRTNLDQEFDQLKAEITRISDNTFFNGISVIGAAATLVFQVGHNSTDVITLATVDMAAESIGSTGAMVGSSDIATTTNAAAALADLDAAIAGVDNYRATLGATANRMEHSAANLYTRIENQMAAKSRIEDADFAVESANLARAQVLQQAGTAMLAQANASSQNVLSLLK